MALFRLLCGLYFNPRSPYGERHPKTKKPTKDSNFNPRSPYGERRFGPVGRIHQPPISIHAPLTGSDRSRFWPFRRNFISIHAPLTGSDEFVQDFIFLDGVFQSTLPLRGATYRLYGRIHDSMISIHAPLTGSDGLCHVIKQVNYISIHAPLTGSDRECLRLRYIDGFQSTLPLRGATTDKEARDYISEISIHAPLTGSDRTFRMHLSPAPNFNPRSPYGERPRTVPPRQLDLHFNPRSPYGERRWMSGLSVLVL